MLSVPLMRIAEAWWDPTCKWPDKATASCMSVHGIDHTDACLTS